MTTTSVPRPEWVEVVTAARDRGLQMFDFLTAVDLEADGFELVLHLWNPQAREGGLMTTRCSREDARFPTLTGVFAGAGWHERAVAELFGIGFDGHDTAPLLLSPTFEGHPLRKEFLLASRLAKKWPGAKEPGESDADVVSSSRRRLLPPGVPR
jgi:NADH-quinone oxidoreductase subunit C